jgi:murein DD-endopeptidase MepM/ murein hydrolase activator NlpD
VSKSRNLVGKLLALACMGVLLAPTVLHAKTTKRGARPSKRAPKVVRGSDQSPTKTPSVRAAKSSRSAKWSRHATRLARARQHRSRRGGRGAVDEHIHVRKGDTLENILAARGVGITEAREWLSATANVFDLTKIRPRHGLTIRFDRETRALESIRYELDQRYLLVAEQAGDGITARLEDLPYFVEVKGIAGQIEHCLRDDTVAAGVPAQIAAEIADIFGWDVDVESGLKRGDEFRVIYENIWQVGLTAPQAGKVLAAELMVGGRRQTAVLFEDEDGNGGYYSPSGEAVSRSFLRYPVEFTEISSGFSLERFHPIRREWRPHYGVDLAAPSGTPVRAAANGVVSESGWESGLGRTVRIDHTGGVASTYGHLSAFAPAVVPGASIERGQVIGYVGSTGLSTGPHLHYELTREGVHVDPLEFTCDREPSITLTLARQFERARREVVRQLASIPGTMQPTSLSFQTSLLQPTE